MGLEIEIVIGTIQIGRHRGVIHHAVLLPVILRHLQAGDLGQKQDYPVFMAVAEKVGFDRRGNTLYKRQPDGEEILIEKTYEEKVRIGGKLKVRLLPRKERILDDDLPHIAAAYAEFRAQHPEPGS